MATKVHKGLWLECKVCPHTAEELEQRKKERRERPQQRHKRTDTSTTLDTIVRRQVSAELGGPEAEPTKDEKFQILQKYGIAAARIDRGVKKPKWMTEAEWNRKRSEFYQATKGLVPKDQLKRNPRQYPRHQQHQPRHQDSRKNNSTASHQNFAPTRMESGPRSRRSY